jgi:hypothetical protein
MMEHENSNKFSVDYKELVCSIQCDALLQENQTVWKEYFEFCSTRLVLSIVDFDKKQLRLFGSATSTFEAGKRRVGE